MLRPLTSGELDQTIVIQSPPPPDRVDAYGQRLKEWVLFAAVRAKAEPLRARELFAAGAVQNEATVRFRIRWRPGVTAAMRVKWRDLVYAISAEPIDVEGRRLVLELLCSSGTRDTVA